MFKKIFVGILVLTVAAAAVMAFTSGQPSTSAATPEVIPTAVPTTPNSQGAGDGTGPVQQQQQQSVDSVGDVWTGSGTITALDTTGMTLNLTDGRSVYIELGPSTYWQAQGVTLNVGDNVTVQGFFNGDQYHAAVVTTADGAVLNVRNESGQPLWSGSANGQSGQSSGQGEAQIPADQWITITGTITAVNTNGLTLQSVDGTLITLQLGRQDFVQGQSVIFSVGDAVEVLGFWQNDQFQAGQITDTTTGERLLLRDPNGRPLWGGPGRTGSSGQGNGNGNGGQGNGNGGQGNGNNKGNGQAGQ